MAFRLTAAFAIGLFSSGCLADQAPGAAGPVDQTADDPAPEDPTPTPPSGAGASMAVDPRLPTIACSNDCGPEPATPEACDDGVDNDLDGAIDCDDADDCGSSCPTACDEPMLLPSTITLDPSMATLQLASTCAPSESMSVTTFYSPAADGILQLELVSDGDAHMFVQRMCGDEDAELACRSGTGEAQRACVPVTADAGAFVLIGGSATSFDVAATLVPTDEIEPNDEAGDAQFVGQGAWIGALSSHADRDVFQIELPAAASGLAIATSSVCADACDEGAIAVDVTIRDASDAIVAQSDPAGPPCGEIGIAGIAAGSYFVEIAARPTAKDHAFGYVLDVAFALPTP